jgi:hypothetical protein
VYAIVQEGKLIKSSILVDIYLTESLL